MRTRRNESIYFTHGHVIFAVNFPSGGSTICGEWFFLHTTFIALRFTIIYLDFS